ncbi:MAG: hypothetical protein J6B48_01975 [Clostridia bacterium]|nr:hypothetical protein [Clostridia bacterium]
MNTRYDIDGIAAKRKSEIFCSIFWCVFGILLLIASIVAMLFKGSNTILFIISAVCAIISLCILFYEKRNAKFGSTKGYSGTVEKIDLKIGANNGIMTVGYGGLVRKKHSQYFRDINRVILYIRSGDDIIVKELSDVSKNLEGYYKVGDEIIHIGGTRFPVKPEITGRWLCPVCGEFNAEEECACRFCKNMILTKQI